MTINNLTTDGSEFTVDGKPYVGSYHVHIYSGAMVGAKHISKPHKKLTPSSEVVAEKVRSLQQRLQDLENRENKIQSTRPAARRQVSRRSQPSRAAVTRRSSRQPQPSRTSVRRPSIRRSPRRSSGGGGY
tara:strand:+ start:255 stop:644 length:390 start_codon:yes stop_codon:yes gene_type:complete